jgi:hypothetical protein
MRGQKYFGLSLAPWTCRLDVSKLRIHIFSRQAGFEKVKEPTPILDLASSREMPGYPLQSY